MLISCRRRRKRGVYSFVLLGLSKKNARPCRMSAMVRSIASPSGSGTSRSPSKEPQTNGASAALERVGLLDQTSRVVRTTTSPAFLSTVTWHEVSHGHGHVHEIWDRDSGVDFPRPTIWWPGMVRAQDSDGAVLVTCGSF